MQSRLKKRRNKGMKALNSAGIGNVTKIYLKVNSVFCHLHKQKLDIIVSFIFTTSNSI